MIDLIQLITVQQAYDEITHERWRASWNWRRRKVDDDDGDDFPSPEPKTDSRSALQMKNRRWRRLRIVKRDESFSLIFFPDERGYIELELGAAELRGAHKPASPGQGGGRASWACGLLAPSLQLILAPVFFIYSRKIPHRFPGHSENFYFCTKTTPWQFCWKQRQSGLVPFKSCKLESKTRAKEFGKVDTTETYQPPKLKAFLVQKQFSWQTERDKRKTFTNSVWSCCCNYV